MIEPTKAHHLTACLIAYFDMPTEQREPADLREIGKALYVEGSAALMNRAFIIAVAYSFGDYTLVQDTLKAWKGIGDWV